MNIKAILALLRNVPLENIPPLLAILPDVLEFLRANGDLFDDNGFNRAVAMKMLHDDPTAALRLAQKAIGLLIDNPKLLGVLVDAFPSPQ